MYSLSELFLTLRCNEPIKDASVLVNGKPYHPNCFSCSTCHKAIGDDMTVLVMMLMTVVLMVVMLVMNDDDDDDDADDDE